jgi:MFS family permease
VSATAPAQDPAAVQRRTVGTLVVSQAVGAVGITIGIATASLLAKEVSGSEAQAGLAQTFQVLGAAVVAYLLARLMDNHGRRVGLVTGYLLGSAGAALAVLAAVVESMPLLLLGAGLLGATTAANSASRYAATDLATEATRARALSIVVWATTIGAVAGPNLSGPAGSLADGLGIPVLAGPFVVGAAAMLVAAAFVWVRLRPDPLVVARQFDVAAPTGVSSVRESSWRRTRSAVRERPVIGWAIAALAGTHAAMIGVMVMTPLHMEHGGASLQIIGVVISVHVLGMFAFSPVMGSLADRFGRAPVISGGGGILLVSLVLCSLAPEGNSALIFAGLFLLGLGWSAATVAASTLISDHAPLSVRTDVQGTADLIMGVSAAGAGAIAGVVTGAFGYPVLALATLALALVVVLAGIRARDLAPRAEEGLTQLPL